MKCVKRKKDREEILFFPLCMACHVLSLCAALLPSRRLYFGRRKHCHYEVEKIFSYLFVFIVLCGILQVRFFFLVYF